MLGLAVAALGATLRLAHAQTAAANPPTNPVDAIARGLKFRADPVEPKDFVRQSRPGEGRLDYIPMGSARSQPPSKALKADQVKAKEAELEAMLARHDRAAGRRPARATTGAAKPKPAVVAR